MENIFRTTSDIKQFVKNALGGSHINWNEADKWTLDEIENLLQAAQGSVDIFERAYNTLTSLQDASLAPAIDKLMAGLADAYAAEHTYSTIVGIKGVMNG